MPLALWCRASSEYKLGASVLPLPTPAARFPLLLLCQAGCRTRLVFTGASVHQDRLSHCQCRCRLDCCLAASCPILPFRLAAIPPRGKPFTHALEDATVDILQHNIILDLDIHVYKGMQINVRIYPKAEIEPASSLGKTTFVGKGASVGRV